MASAPIRVLLVEDDVKISAFLAKSLQEAGYDVSSAYDGDEGLLKAKASVYNIIIVDVMLPKSSGLELIQTLRAAGSMMPVLILSAKRSVQDRLSGFEIGGDDYLVKPFAFEELLARMTSLLRRSQPKTEPLNVVIGDIHVDIVKREVSRADKKIELQSKEYSLLELFIKNPNRVITKSEVLKSVWGYQFDPQTNVVDVLVCRLRNKIDRGQGEKLIQTIRGVGYVLKVS